MMDKKQLKKAMRESDCTGCDHADTHEDDGCYMFEDRAICYIKRNDRTRKQKAHINDFRR